MKKRIYILCLLVASFFILIPVTASTNTYPRTEDNLGISSDIEVTSENKEFILNTPKIDASEKIYDFADLFTEQEEQDLYNVVSNYISNTDYDLAVVTIDYNPKRTFYSQSQTTVYADDFYDYNDFKKDGAVILIDMDNREYYVGASGQAILMYDDVRIDNILDVGESYVKAENYYVAVYNMISEMKEFHTKGIPESNQNCIINNEGKYVCQIKMPYLAIAGVSFVITFLTVFFLVKSYKQIKKASSASIYVENDKTKINKAVDQFLYSSTTRVKITDSSSGGSSFRGGGSSSHSSSSGRSHGGGGRKF